MCSIFGLIGKSIPQDVIKECFDRTLSRGPDMSRLIETPCGWLGFHRLAIMGLDERGMQPFRLDDDYVVCNGELYGFRPIRDRLMAKYAFSSQSDCEILLPLYREYGLDMFRTLDAEFALILYDAKKNTLIAARDPIGIRPLYYGQLADGGMAFASEPKNLIGLCETILPFPPGCYWADGEFVRYADAAHVDQFSMDDEHTACTKLHDLLIEGVKKRLDADAPVGFLLSGGLDSSLVCAIAQHELKKPIKTFAIGMDVDAIDLKYARMVAEYIGSEHTEVIISEQDVLGALPHVVELLGTGASRGRARRRRGFPWSFPFPAARGGVMGRACSCNSLAGEKGSPPPRGGRYGTFGRRAACPGKGERFFRGACVRLAKRD